MASHSAHSDARLCSTSESFSGVEKIAGTHRLSPLRHCYSDMFVNCLPRMGEVLVHVMSRQKRICRCFVWPTDGSYLGGELGHGTRCLTDLLAICHHQWCLHPSYWDIQKTDNSNTNTVNIVKHFFFFFIIQTKHSYWLTFILNRKTLWTSTKGNVMQYENSLYFDVWGL